ncbi:MAG: GNAT family N-acetyltransferase [Pseudomonadota bacterium]
MSLRVECHPVLNLEDTLIERWRRLEDRALEPNAFLSPSFVLPAVRNLCPGKRPFAILVFLASGGGNHLVGAGVFDRLRASRIFPLPHVAAFVAPQETFMTGLLLDRDHADPAAESILAALAGLPGTHGIVFEQRCLNSAQGELLAAVSRRLGFPWTGKDYSRPILDRNEMPPDYPRGFLSRNSLKKRRRGLRELQQKGELVFKFHDSTALDNQDEILNEFMRLEHMGWKADAGTSLLSTPSRTRFFQEMCKAFSQSGQLLWSQTSVGGTVISSTCNLVSGRCGFAYKLGWDTDYADARPGMLQEVELAKTFQRGLSELEAFDSCVDEGSFLTGLWSGRRTVSSGVFAVSRSGELLARTLARVRRLKQQGKASTKGGFKQ